MGMKLQKIVITLIVLASASVASCQSVEEFEKKHRASIATPEGKTYKSLATAEF